METKDAMATNRTKCNPRGFGFIWNMYGLVFMNNRYSNTVVFRQNTNCTYSSHNHLLFLFFFRPISKKNSVSYDYHYSVFRTNAGFLHFLIIWMRRTDTNSNLNTVNEVSESWLCINPLDEPMKVKILIYHQLFYHFKRGKKISTRPDQSGIEFYLEDRNHG